MEPSVMEQLRQAREVVLNNQANYPTIVPIVLPIIGADADVGLRRWGAEFLAEALSSPLLHADQKQQLGMLVLDKLREFLDRPGEDVAVVKAAVQAATSIFPLLFRYIISNPHDGASWQKMTQIKTQILRYMDTTPSGVRICCIKFAERVVQTQTPGLISDPRRPDHNEISLALVPRDHPLIPPPNLEAEASGLLDRLLSIFQDGESDALLVTATLNGLGSLIRTRASVSNKIISTILNFNPLKLLRAPITPTVRVGIKSMERTVRGLLLNVVKRNPNHALAPRIQQHIDRLHHARLEILGEINRKRPAPAVPGDELDSAKRRRLEANAQATSATGVPPLSSGPVSYAQLYTLTEDEGSRNFDVQAIPLDLVVRILVPILHSIDRAQLDNAINAVRLRYLSRVKEQTRAAADAAAVAGAQNPPVADEDDDYEPVFRPTEDAEQIINKFDGELPDADGVNQRAELPLTTFSLPLPPTLTSSETAEHSKNIINRVFGIMSALDDNDRAKPQRHGFNRLAASSYDRDAWVTVIARLATRALAGLDGSVVKKEEGESDDTAAPDAAFSMSDAIRNALYLYVIEGFRRRIGVAVSWLCEEWYNDRLCSAAADAADAAIARPVRQYEKWAVKVLDGMLPYLDAKDKVLIRFLSEIPELVPGMVDRVKSLARDPERISLAVNTIHYLGLMRPPVREACIDAIEDLWENYDGAKGPTAKLLQKWRPDVLRNATGDVKAG